MVKNGNGFKSSLQTDNLLQTSKIFAKEGVSGLLVISVLRYECVNLYKKNQQTNTTNKRVVLETQPVGTQFLSSSSSFMDSASLPSGSQNGLWALVPFSKSFYSALHLAVRLLFLIFRD